MVQDQKGDVVLLITWKHDREDTRGPSEILHPSEIAMLHFLKKKLGFTHLKISTSIFVLTTST